MSRVILFTSADERSDRPLHALILAHGLAQHRRVLFADLDTLLRSADLLSGLQDRAVYTLRDFVQAGARLRDCLLRDESNLDLYLMFSPPDPDFKAEEQQLRAICEKLKDRFDVILLNVHPYSPSLSAAMAVSDCAAVMAAYTPASLRGVRNLGRHLSKEGRIDDQRLILTQLPAKERIPVDDIIDSAGMRLAGLIPASEEVQGQPFSKLIEQKHCDLFRIYVEIATRIMEL
ncbi:hypothetical protein [Candidatus Soleaferrea massiliensis]|uniref:hypothetical protein n=1 Tax=Candidatus Soleaferrea massiliensis TaxID=1470354 RepID=UPI0005912E2B|nr:hypothetical protein [Candidatus Soleaferrea massiliensis]